jgi:hypothetical protein
MSFLRYVEGSILVKKLKRLASADERQVAKKSMIKNPGKKISSLMDERSFFTGLPLRRRQAILSLMFCNWRRNNEVDSVFVRETNKFKLDAVKQHESSKPHQFYQSRYMYISNPTEPTESTASQCKI